jgi:4-alpha-glucanotransferase
VDDAIRELASEAGIATDWIDAAGAPRRVAIEPLRSILAALGFPATSTAVIAESRARLRGSREQARNFVTATAGVATALTGLTVSKAMRAELSLENGEDRALTIKATRGEVVVPPLREPGYHRLRVANREITLAVAPPRCVTFGDVAPDARLWGLALQLYSLRRSGDGGFGDTGALAEFVTSAARAGADAVALSPVHSLFAADPAHFGPYSPSSRLFLNPLFADPALVLGAAPVADGGKEQECQEELIDWPAAARRKYQLLRSLFDHLCAGGDPLSADFESFVRDGGERLREHALFEALHQHWFGAAEPKWNFAEWPAEWRSPNGAAIDHFAATGSREVQFHLFAQWMAARSFARVQQRARDVGMRVGLISDLAIGMNPGGSHAWSRQQDLLPGLNVGAPPDLFNARGQDWGLTGFSPQALIASGFEPFIATLRAAMRHAGGVRIDHAMGLARLWLVPHGASAKDGAYLAYPVDDLMRLLALESYRHRAVVIAEDLGTVEPAFRKQLAKAGVAGMDVLWFMRKGRSFLAPRKWRREAVAMTTTHDLPTVAGWWQGADIATRGALGLVAEEKREAQERAQDRSALWRALRKAGESLVEEPCPGESAPAVDAAIGFTAQSPAPLALIPIEDILGLPEQPNVPGTVDEHPNWRRRLDRPAGTVLEAPAAQRRLKILRERRK